jgi:hypothetical protein
VDACLGREQPVGVLALDAERRALYARLLTLLVLDDLGLEAAPLGPLQVHLEQHLGPVLRLRSARAGVDGADGIAGVVLAGEHHLGLGLGDLAPEPFEQSA